MCCGIARLHDETWPLAVPAVAEKRQNALQSTPHKYVDVHEPRFTYTLYSRLYTGTYIRKNARHNMSMPKVKWMPELQLAKHRRYGI